MQNGFIKVFSSDLEDLLACFKRKYSFKYINRGKDCITLVGDYYSIIDRCFEVRIIILRKESDYLKVEIYCGGGEINSLLSLGSEIDFVLEIRQDVMNYATQGGYKME